MCCINIIYKIRLMSNFKTFFSLKTGSGEFISDPGTSVMFNSNFGVGEMFIKRGIKETKIAVEDFIKVVFVIRNRVNLITTNSNIKLISCIGGAIISFPYNIMILMHDIIISNSFMGLI